MGYVIDGLSDIVFVYGTLKKGYNNHHIIEHCDFIGEGVVTHLNCEMYDSGFPIIAINHKIPDREVLGEIYVVNNKETWERLDQLEGYPNFYRRILVSVDNVQNGKDFTAVMYVASENTAARLRENSTPVKPIDDEWFVWPECCEIQRYEKQLEEKLKKNA